MTVTFHTLLSDPLQRRRSESTAACSSRIHNGFLDPSSKEFWQGEKSLSFESNSKTTCRIYHLVQIPRNKGPSSVKDMAHIHSWLQLRSNTNGPGARSLRRDDARPWGVHQIVKVASRSSTVAKREQASFVPWLRLKPGPEPPSHSWCLGNSISRTAARRVHLPPRQTRLEFVNCQKRADRKTWAHLVDRDRFLSPETVSMKPQDRADSSSGTSLQSIFRSPSLLPD